MENAFILLKNTIEDNNYKESSKDENILTLENNGIILKTELQSNGNIKCFFCGNFIKQIKRHYTQHKNCKNMIRNSEALNEFCAKVNLQRQRENKRKQYSEMDPEERKEFEREKKRKQY